MKQFPSVLHDDNHHQHGAGSSPDYLVSLLRENNPRGDGGVLRRCQKCLPVIWRGLAQYTGDPLLSRMAWEERVRPHVLQRWYAIWSMAAAGGGNGKGERWMRYTLNRLAGRADFHVRHRTRAAADADVGAGGPRRSTTLQQQSRRRRLQLPVSIPKETYRPLRLVHHQEAVVSALLEGCPPDAPDVERMRYCLRRFVVSYPVWDVATVHAMTDEDVRWWIEHRRPAVVADKGPTDGWFDAVLQNTLAQVRLRWLLTHEEEEEEAVAPTAAAVAARRRTIPLLYDTHRDGIDLRRIPVSVALFFRHYFRDDEREYVRRLQDDFLGRDLTITHTRQVWDFVRDWWIAQCPQPGSMCPNEVVIDDTKIWEWLLGVYRRQGGGGVTRGGRLPTPCTKALCAIQVVLRHYDTTTTSREIRIRPREPTRIEFIRRIRIIAAQEEATVPAYLTATPTGGPRGRTYTDAECAALLAGCRTHRDRLILLLLQRVGLRNAALRHLTIRDTTEDDPPHAPREVARAMEKGGVVRCFWMDPEIRRCFTQYMAEEYTPCVRPGWDRHTAYLFPRCHTQPEEPLTPTQFHWWFRGHCERVGVRGPHATIHGFRHYLITRLMENKENRLVDVAQFMGHRSLATTANTYWHVDLQGLHHRLAFPWKGGDDDEPVVLCPR